MNNWTIDKILISFLEENIFYAEISRRVQKIEDKNIPTAYVTWDQDLDCLSMHYNPDFFQKFTPKQQRGLIKHELNHLVYGHLLERRRTRHVYWNIATDLAINSLIYEEDKTTHKNKNALPLPECVLVPGKLPIDSYSSDKKTSNKVRPLAQLIANMDELLASENYFHQILKAAEKEETCPVCNGTGKISLPSNSNQQNSDSDNDNDDSEGDDNEIEIECPNCNGSGSSAFGEDWTKYSIDDHSSWDKIDVDMQDYVDQRIKNIIENAVNSADQTSNGWGNIPKEISSAIRRSVSRIIPWQSVLRQFVGTLVPNGRRSTVKRINKRYPYIHPGSKRHRTPGLLIAIDQSGSVDNDMLTLFFAELTNLAKKCDIEIIAFDTQACAKDIYKWKKGQLPPKGRERCGGTDFNAITTLVNDPKNRGRWDGVLIATDGECYKPEATCIKRGWILPPGHNLNFASDELQIIVESVPKFKGSWR